MTSERNAEMLRRREAGETIVSIAKSYGITKSRAGQIIATAKDVRDASGNWNSGFSTRLRHTLLNKGIETEEQARALSVEDLQGLNNAGAMTIREFDHWLRGEPFDRKKFATQPPLTSRPRLPPGYRYGKAVK